MTLGNDCVCVRTEMGGEGASRWIAATAAEVPPDESKVVQEPRLQVTQFWVAAGAADCT